jgi:hypothetical protein
MANYTQRTILLITILFHSLIGRAQATNKIETIGYVGVGTLSPQDNLNVVGASFFQGTSAGVRIGGDNAGGYGFVSAYDQNISSFKPLILQTSGGYVGIGTSTPSEKLSVVGNVNVNGTSFTYGINAGVRIGADNTGAYGFITAYDENLSASRALILQTSGGYVGIGTSTPFEKLSVEGNVYANGNISAYGYIKAKKIVVTQTGWPDYVFATDYKLRDLRFVETFIKQNKHLPGVPSAKDVEVEGISLGDNQALLLKKIEELTLYLIQQQKAIKRQNIKIELQAVQIKRLMKR